jgi:hypothetical protein
MYTRGCVLNPVIYKGDSLTPSTVTWNDQSRAKNHGALTNIIWTKRPNGLYVPVFNGATSIITITDKTSIQNIFSIGGTVLAWIFALSDGEGDDGRIVQKSDDATLGFYVHIYDELVGFAKLSFSIMWTGGWASWSTTNRVIELNRHNFITCSYNSSSINNDPVLTVNDTVPALTEDIAPVGAVISDAGQNMTIGNNPATNRTFDGNIMPGIYRRILSLTRIWQIYEKERLTLFGA